MSHVIELRWKVWQDVCGATSASNHLRAGLRRMKTLYATALKEETLSICWWIYCLAPALRAVTLTLSPEVPNSETSHP